MDSENNSSQDQNKKEEQQSSSSQQTEKIEKIDKLSKKQKVGRKKKQKQEENMNQKKETTRQQNRPQNSNDQENIGQQHQQLNDQDIQDQLSRNFDKLLVNEGQKVQKNNSQYNKLQISRGQNTQRLQQTNMGYLQENPSILGSQNITTMQEERPNPPENVQKINTILSETQKAQINKKKHLKKLAKQCKYKKTEQFCSNEMEPESEQKSQYPDNQGRMEGEESQQPMIRQKKGYSKRGKRDNYQIMESQQSGNSDDKKIQVESKNDQRQGNMQEYEQKKQMQIQIQKQEQEEEEHQIEEENEKRKDENQDMQ